MESQIKVWDKQSLEGGKGRALKSSAVSKNTSFMILKAKKKFLEVVAERGFGTAIHKEAASCCSPTPFSGKQELHLPLKGYYINMLLVWLLHFSEYFFLSALSMEEFYSSDSFLWKYPLSLLRHQLLMCSVQR